MTNTTKAQLDTLWREFTKYGSGFKLEGERIYDEKGQPVFYHLHMYGLVYPNNYELVGETLTELLQQAIDDGKRGWNELNNKRNNHD